MKLTPLLESVFVVSPVREESQTNSITAEIGNTVSQPVVDPMETDVQPKDKSNQYFPFGDPAKRVGVDKPDFPSLAAAAATKTKKKKPQTLSLQEFTTYKPSQRIAAKGLTHNELLALPTGPRQRSAEELDHNKICGGFKNYGSLNERPSRDEHPRRQGSFNRDSSRESGLSRADETDNWASGKKLTVGNGFERRERGGFFSDSQSQADESDNWGSKKAFVPSERRYDRRGGFGLESNNGGADTNSWDKGDSRSSKHSDKDEVYIISFAMEFDRILYYDNRLRR
ncbi:Eukaryotic translation initiation factor 3 subunit A [Forsythia ovata]|uniref:Eukaryotic translation initiation factor 3 subunit A n=1 Tax=Forsythia ovata TaxID=205694 RepID=A0ABD1NUM0_9LAMI